MLTLETALKLLQLASGAAPVVQAIYESAKPLLGDADQAALKAAYEKAFADASRMHDELQAEPIKPAN
jgi:hypothetical protein